MYLFLEYKNSSQGGLFYTILSHNFTYCTLYNYFTHLQCPVTEHVLEHEFSELAEEMSLTDADGELCLVEEEEEHGHKGEGLESE